MAKQRHIGLVIFAVCCALSARIAMFEPQHHRLTPAEERWGAHQTDDSDPLGLIHGLRYYIYGVGVVGLLMVLEDISMRVPGKRRKKIPDKQQSLTPNQTLQ